MNALHVLIAGGLALTSTARSQEQPAAAPEASREDVSYGLGYRTGSQFRNANGHFGLTPADLEPQSFLKGFMDAFGGGDPSVPEETFAAASQALGDLIQAREEEIAKRNLAAGAEFLASTAEKKDVLKLEDGLLYEILKLGDGETYKAPKEGEPGKQFLVHYTGSLIDGTRFDSSPPGETMAMTLESHPMSMRVIPGIEQALRKMPVGSKWKLYIPSELAYGERRRSAEVGPNAALVFEIELVKIEDIPAHHGGLPVPIEGGE